MADKEYIEREALLNMRFSRGFNNDGELLVPFGEVTKSIRLAPTADVVEVRHGVWLHHRTDENYMVIVKCSACNAKRYGRSLYCPNCGADMRGVKNGKE